MSANLYDAEFYAARRPLLPEYQAMARVLHTVFEPKRVLDCGCGPGEIINEIDDLGGESLGLDSSVHAGHERYKRGAFFQLDMTESGLTVKDMDLVLCMEVAEHVPESKADALVEFVARNTARWLVWSAATPGQGGTGHVNEQETAYWLEKLMARRLVPHFEFTEAMRLLFAAAAPRQPWYGRTTTVFERPR